MIAGILIVMERAPLGFGIRWSTQSGDEGRGNANHTANWFRLDDGQEFLIHSTIKGTHELLNWTDVYDKDRYWGVVVVPVGYTEDDHWAVLAHSRELIGRKYDRCAIAKHFFDGIAGKLLRRPVYFFRRFRLKFWKRQDRYNICSWLSCHTWGKIGLRVVGMVRGKRRLFRKRKLKRANLECRFVAPNDFERTAFLHDRRGYRVFKEIGKRPKDLGPEWRDKIATDLDRGLDLLFRA